MLAKYYNFPDLSLVGEVFGQLRPLPQQVDQTGQAEAQRRLAGPPPEAVQ